MRKQKTIEILNMKYEYVADYKICSIYQELENGMLLAFDNNGEQVCREMILELIHSIITDRVKNEFMNKTLCPNCKTKMELFGITDNSAWKFYCSKCYTMIKKYEPK